MSSKTLQNPVFETMIRVKQHELNNDPCGFNS